jgi:transcriptional regulator with XRE-family HTH domain
MIAQTVLEVKPYLMYTGCVHRTVRHTVVERKDKTMSPFGSKVREILERSNLNAEWLHNQTGLTKSTISDWMTKADVTPRPGTVKRVAKALAPYGASYEELSEAAGYAFVASADESEREARRREAVRANPRVGRHIDRILALDARRQDEWLSFDEAWHISQRRKDPPGSQ